MSEGCRGSESAEGLGFAWEAHGVARREASWSAAECAAERHAGNTHSRERDRERRVTEMQYMYVPVGHRGGKHLRGLDRVHVRRRCAMRESDGVAAAEAHRGVVIQASSRIQQREAPPASFVAAQGSRLTAHGKAPQKVAATAP